MFKNCEIWQSNINYKLIIVLQNKDKHELICPKNINKHKEHNLIAYASVLFLTIFTELKCGEWKVRRKTGGGTEFDTFIDISQNHHLTSAFYYLVTLKCFNLLRILWQKLNMPEKTMFLLLLYSYRYCNIPGVEIGG
jgi:hypothetical protein